MGNVLAPTEEIPIYCKECHTRNSWVRNHSGDILSESGKTLWRSYRCIHCHATTIKPVIYKKGC